MTNQIKHQIKANLEQKLKLLGSMRKLAAHLNFISVAQISNVLNKKKWQFVSSSTWNRLMDSTEFNSQWTVIDTTPTRFITELLKDSQKFGNTYHLIGNTGTGKTVSSKTFVSSNMNAFRIECADHLNRKAFLVELLQTMGKNTSGLTIYEIMREIEAEIIKMDSPIIILDEFDKLKDEVFYFFITLYNRLSGRCGIFLMSTNFMERRTRMGLRVNKKGYQEYFSRIGKKFIHAPNPTTHDVKAICVANGVSAKPIIEKAIRECEGDLRRVERIVNSERRKRQFTT